MPTATVCTSSSNTRSIGISFPGSREASQNTSVKSWPTAADITPSSKGRDTVTSSTICKPFSSSNPHECGVELTVPRARISQHHGYVTYFGARLEQVKSATPGLPKPGPCGGRVLIALRQHAEHLGVQQVTLWHNKVIVRVASSREKLKVVDLLTDLVMRYPPTV